MNNTTITNYRNFVDYLCQSSLSRLQKSKSQIISQNLKNAIESGNIDYEKVVGMLTHDYNGTCFTKDTTESLCYPSGVYTITINNTTEELLITKTSPNNDVDVICHYFPHNKSYTKEKKVCMYALHLCTTLSGRLVHDKDAFELLDGVSKFISDILKTVEYTKNNSWNFSIINEFGVLITYIGDSCVEDGDTIKRCSPSFTITYLVERRLKQVQWLLCEVACLLANDCKDPMNLLSMLMTTTRNIYDSLKSIL
jgi:hypothetical protein